MGAGETGTVNALANRAGDVYHGGASCSADSSAQSEFDKAFSQAAQKSSDAGQTLVSTDPTALTPREEALQQCLPENERHLPPPCSQKINGRSQVHGTGTKKLTVDDQMMDILNNPRLSENEKVAELQKAIANLPESEKKDLYERLKDSKSNDPLAQQFHYPFSHHPNGVSTTNQVLNALKPAESTSQAPAQDSTAIRNEPDVHEKEIDAARTAALALSGQTVRAAPAGAVPIVHHETEEELRAQLAAVQAQINAERVRIADVEQAAPKSPTWEVGPSGIFERKDWNAIRASETKAYYNLLERRDILQLRLNFPDHQFLEQVSINRVVTRNGQVFNIPERIADWALIKDDEIILGDKKTAGAIQSGIKGGVPRNRPVTPADLQGSFRTTKGRFTRGGNEQSRTKFGDQVMKERYAIMRATALDGDIIVSGKAADGSTVERKVPPSGLRVSRLNPYGQLPDKLVDEPAGGKPPPRSTPGGRSPRGGGMPGPDEPAPGAPMPTRQGGTGPTAAGHQDEPAAAPPPARTTTAPPPTTPGHADEPAHTPAPPPAKAATPGSTTPPGEEANVGAPPGTFGGPITRGQVIAAGADVVSVVLVQVLNRYIEESYAGIRAQATREYISDAIVAAYPDMQRQISRRSLDIVDAQRRGKTAQVYVVVKVGFTDYTESNPVTGTTGTTVSNVPSTSHVMDIQVLLEGERPKPYDESTSLIGDLFREVFSYRSRYYYISLPLGGTDMKLRHQIETAQKVDAAIGRRGSFEELIVQSRLGGQDPAELREYAEYKAQYAQPSRGGIPIGRDDSVEYWRRMRALIDGPLEDVVKEARLKSVPLEALKQRVGPESDIGKLIDAPLADKELVARQEHQWTLGGTDAEIARQRAIVEPLRTELRQKQQILNSLYQMDARTAEERAGGEPPHPPWARIARLKQDLADLTERLLVEDKLLKSLEK
jgi:hypothetical protein